jgi:hypothetical protein
MNVPLSRRGWVPLDVAETERMNPVNDGAPGDWDTRPVCTHG